MTCESWNLDMIFLAKRVSFEHDSWTYVSWKSTRGNQALIAIDDISPERIRLKYSVQKAGGESVPYSYNVYIETTPCNYGGKRWWFRCPSCHRRCRVLYLPYYAKVFACRICHNLTYESQQVGRPGWVALSEAIFKLPKWEEQWCRARSEKKRQRLQRKMNRVYPGMQAIVKWGNRKRRRRSRKP